MDKNLPTYKISKGDGMSQVAYTKTPAIMIKGVYLSDVLKKYTFKDNLLGQLAAPAMVPDMPIYRKDDDLGEYNVVFTKEVIQSLRSDFMKNKDKAVFNLDHNPEDQVMDKSYILDSWITGPSETDLSYTRYGIECPEGSWFVVSQFTDLDYFKKNIIDDDRTGYSIEGMLGLEFKRIEQEIKKQNMKIKLAEIIKADGTNLFIDGEVAIDTYVYSEEPSYQLQDGKRVEIKYPIWDNIIELQDGSILTLDGGGKILEITKKEASNSGATQTQEQKMNKLKFSMEKLQDGTPVWVSDMSVGGEVYTVDQNMDKAPIFDGDHILTDGSVVSTVAGKITEIKKSTANEEMADSTSGATPSDSTGVDTPAATPSSEAILAVVNPLLDELRQEIAQLKTLIETDVEEDAVEDENEMKEQKMSRPKISLSNLFKAMQ